MDKKCNHPIRKLYVKDKNKQTQRIIIKCGRCYLELTEEENKKITDKEIIEDYNHLIKTGSTHNSAIASISNYIGRHNNYIENIIKGDII